MPDQFLIGYSPNYQFRFIVASFSELIQEQTEIHDLNANSASLFSKTILGTFFLASSLKNEERISIQWKNPNHLDMLVFSDRYGNVKASATEIKHRTNSQNSEIIDPTLMNVLRWDQETVVYKSVTEILPGSLEENLENYFLNSDQLPTKLKFFYQHKKDSKPQVLGFLIQSLPGASEEQLNGWNTRLSGLFLQETTEASSDEELYKELVTRLEDDLQILSEGSPSIYCECSWEKIRTALLLLGKTEAESLFESKKEEIEVKCEFCRKAFYFNYQDIVDLFS